MSVILVKLPQRKRNRIQIIRDDKLIVIEKIAREEKLGIIKEIIAKAIEPEIIEPEIVEPEIEVYKEPEPIKFTQEFIFSSSNQPIVISLNNIPEPALPVRVVKEEIQKSYDRGMQDGQIQAKAIFQTEIDKYNQWITRFDTIAEDLKSEHHIALKKLEESVVSISLLIAQHIIGRQASEDSNLVLELVRKAISSLENDFVYKIHVHPDSVHILEAVKSTLLDDKEVSNKIVITSDTSVDLGGCVLETSAGMIDARISSQLEMLKKPLIGSINEIAEKENSDELEEIEDIELARLKDAEDESMEEMKRLWADEFEDEDFENQKYDDTDLENVNNEEENEISEMESKEEAILNDDFDILEDNNNVEELEKTDNFDLYGELDFIDKNIESVDSGLNDLNNDNIDFSDDDFKIEDN
ncbi:MAG: FliH/SctL family protein [Candidatus Kapabacteria bacterium]|nr:FliH/SctL family protein [Candidatus Kapabacteria bacterium]